MEVKLLTYTYNPAMTVYKAARSCYHQDAAFNIEEPEDIETFISGIIKSGHHSPLEHASFTFSVKGISRACSHQLVRHRIASYSQQSQRYVKFGNENKALDDSDFVIPPSIKEHEVLLLEFLDACTCSMASYFDLVDGLIERGRTDEQAQEDARYLLPNASKTNIVVTMNARELRTFFSLRICKRAQWEIRDLAKQMRGICVATSGILFYNTGADCMYDECHEGRHSCGEPYEQGI